MENSVLSLFTENSTKIQLMGLKLREWDTQWKVQLPKEQEQLEEEQPGYFC
jgi:hypothetical protein